jgi:hypothetical protein
MFVSRDVHLENPFNDKSSAAISCLMDSFHGDNLH